MRYYYKNKNGKGYLNLKTPLNKEEAKKYVVLTKEQFESETAIPAYEPTAEEIKQNRIAELKANLARTDYEAIKFSEGEMSAEDYEPYKIQRRAWRAEINTLEEEFK